MWNFLIYSENFCSHWLPIRFLSLIWDARSFLWTPWEANHLHSIPLSRPYLTNCTPLWSMTTKNPGVNTGKLAHPLARLLVPLIRLLLTACFTLLAWHVCFAALIRLLAHSLTHCRACGIVNDDHMLGPPAVLNQSELVHRSTTPPSTRPHHSSCRWSFNWWMWPLAFPLALIS